MGSLVIVVVMVEHLHFGNSLDHYADSINRNFYKVIDPVRLNCCQYPSQHPIR